MAELDTSGGGKKGGGKVRTKKANTKVDGGFSFLVDHVLHAYNIAFKAHSNGHC
jgi:hypothetical protein